MSTCYQRFSNVEQTFNTTAPRAAVYRIIVRHIFPNLIDTLLVLATLGLGSAVISEATLSFLELGIPRPQPSWGTMLAESQKYLYTA